MLRKLINKLKKVKHYSEETKTLEWATFHSATTDRALERIVKRGMQISTVVDVGASNGSWSEVCLRHFPSPTYLLLEAQALHSKELEVFCNKHCNSKYVLAAAGNEDGVCFFDDSDPFGGLASNEATNGCKTELPMVRIDTLVAKEDLKGPFLLKLDTHGFELQIIQGAEDLLLQTELAIFEAYIFRLNDKALLAHELCAEMDKRGFQMIDFSEPMWRSKDMALWQLDLFFVKKSNSVFGSNSYS